MKYEYPFAALIIGCASTALVGFSVLQAQVSQPDRAGMPESHTVPSRSATQRGVTLKIECSENLVSGAANLITIVVRNEGDQAVEFSRTAPQFLGAGFSVVRHRKPVSKTAHGTAYLVPSPYQRGRQVVRLKTGQEVRIVADLSRYYDLSLPGKYQIIATWWGTAVGEEEPIQIRTEPLDFQVKIEPGESVSGPQDHAEE